MHEQVKNSLGIERKSRGSWKARGSLYDTRSSAIREALAWHLRECNEDEPVGPIAQELLRVGGYDDPDPSAVEELTEIIKTFFDERR